MTATPVNGNGFTLFRLVLPCLVLAGHALGLTACSQNHDGSVAAPAPVHITIGGRAMGGQQPVTGSTVYIYQVTSDPVTGNVTGTMVLGHTTTNAGGAWSLTISCPSSNPVYAVALAGNPGAGNNAQIGLSAVLGDCAKASALNNVNINEITTVAMIEAFSQFLDRASATMVVTTAADGTAVTLGNVTTAVDYAQMLADASTGQEPAALPAAATLKENTLADLMAACVNSTGGGAGDNSACGQLFSTAKAPGDTAPTTTLQAMLDVALAPGNNVLALYQLIPPSPVFAPTPGSVPFDWSLPPAGLITALASIHGLLAYQSGVYDDGTDQIYLYNFKTGANTLLNPLWNGPGGTQLIKNTSNPSISPDGLWLAFSAISIAVDRYHIYLWKIDGSVPLIDLTSNSAPGTRLEDAKWAPDGTHIIYKNTGNIAVMAVDFAANPPTVSSDVLITTNGSEGGTTEYSAPYFMPNQTDVVFFTGVQGAEIVGTLSTTNPSVVTPLGEGVSGYQEFYPIPWPGGDDQLILFVRWTNTSDHHNEICSLDLANHTAANGESNPCLFVTGGANNDDPFPADQAGQYVFFGSDRPGGVINQAINPSMTSSDLYLGDAKSPGHPTWSLTSLGINTSSDELAPAYFAGN